MWYKVRFCPFRNINPKCFTLKDEEYRVKFLMCKILISKYNAQNPTGNVSPFWRRRDSFSLYLQLQKETYRTMAFFFFTIFFHFKKKINHSSAVKELKLSHVRINITLPWNTKCRGWHFLFYFGWLFILPTDLTFLFNP